MSRIKGKLTTADYLDIEDFNRLVDSLHQDKKYLWELYCRISFCTALHVSDVLSIKWADILMKDELCMTEKKTGKTRKIQFNDSVVKKIAELYNLLGRPDTSFPIISNGKPAAFSDEYVNRTLKMFRVKYRLPIKSFSTHTFRKTFGRFVYESNGRSAESLILLNSIFQHSNLETTKIYIGIRQTEINNVFKSIKF